MDPLPEDNDAGDDEDAFRYRAFLSYSHEDRHWARWLMRRIETYRVPKHLVGRVTAYGKVPARLAPVFRDRDELASAGHLDERIEAALADSAALIVIASPASAQSRWVNEEVLAFKRMGREDRIHCFIVDGDPDGDPDGDDAADCFATALRRRIGPDGELTDAAVDLIAADARPAGDGRQRALTRLIAGLLGVSYDDLRQRELVRRNRRLMIIAVASALGMAVTATLAGMALLARDDAERRRLQAEGLVGFMLGDLYERLYEIGRVDIYNAIGDQATAYFQSMEKDDLTDTALAQRSESLRQIGETRADQGQLDAALEAFELALELSEGVTTRQPDRIDWRLGLAETHYWIGYVGWRRGDLDVAAAGFEKQLQVQEAVLAGGTESAELVREMGYAYTNLGRVEEGRGQFEPALTHYLRVLELNKRYLQMDPDNADALLEIGFANNNLGVLLMRMGRLETAEDYFREDLAIKQKVAANEPGNGLWGEYVSTSEYFLGRLLEYRGAVDEASDYYKAAEAGAGRLFEESRANDARARSFANALRKTAELSTRIGEYEPAATRLEEAVAILQSRREDHQDDARWLRDLARAQIAAGRLALATGDLSLSETRSAEADAILLQLLALSPDSVEFQHAYMTGLLLQGDIERADGDETASAEIWARLAADMAVQVRDSRDPEWLAPYAGTLIRLGRRDEAAPLIQTLSEMGYARPGYELNLAGGG